MKKRSLLLLAFLATLTLSLRAQSVQNLSVNIAWDNEPVAHPLSGGDFLYFWGFENCVYRDDYGALPFWATRVPLDGPADLTATLSGAQYERFARPAYPDDALLTEEAQVFVTLEKERRNYFARISVLPLRRQGGQIERLRSFSLALALSPRALSPDEVKSRGGGNFAYNSVLNDGEIYKFGIANTSVYRLDYAYLKNELGVANLDNIDPRTIRIYGNGGAMLPERNADARPDDLIENPIFVSGEADGKFDPGDYILLFAEGPLVTRYAPATGLNMRINLYDRHSWYFVKIGPGFGERITEAPSEPATYVSDTFDDVARLEDERVNLLDEFVSAQGSGKRWFGDYFFQQRERTYNFNFPNAVTGVPAKARAEFAGRSNLATTVRMSSGGSVYSSSISATNTSNVEATFAFVGVISGEFPVQGDNIAVTITYPNVSALSEGWLDYIEINARRRLLMTGQGMLFRDLQTLDQLAATFRIGGVNGDLQVWDVTDMQRPQRRQLTGSGEQREFGAATQGMLKQFYAFYDTPTLPKPEAKVGKIANQNVHATDNVDMLIVYHRDFKAQAEQLAYHRRNHTGLDVALADVEQVFNEFSSGKKDPAAIRDMARMLYERNPDKFRFMLLLGDGSFDPKNNTNSISNLDFIPVFETEQSFNPVTAFPTDDFMALLDPNEGGSLFGALDINVGRLPVNTPAEAQQVIAKIIDYETNPQTLGDWRLRQIYVADDEDSNAHINQAEKLSKETLDADRRFNVEKLYLDAFQQIATSAGQRSPDMKAALNANVFRSSLTLNYIGHGGPRGWMQERLLDNNDIANWANTHRYPLIITATCSFGGFDDFKTLTGGEQALLKPLSGAMGLFTTVRAVFISGNNLLTNAVQLFLFKKEDNQYLPIGDILRRGKNVVGDADNSRRFALLGDPAMRLAIPPMQVFTTHINGKAVQEGLPDTLRALAPVEIEGAVADDNGQILSNFNGRVFVSIFDKPLTLQTLGADSGSFPINFTVQRNILFRGSATVSNGRFKIKFVMPKNIDFTFGKGKISYYAENGTPIDAAGADENIVIGGNSDLINDDQPPVVQVFMNTAAFAFGGITDANPKLLAKFEDDHGINVSTAGLGHDITATLDGNALQAIVLNDFYESATDNFQRGQVIYPLTGLSVGRHTVQVRAFDVANNPGEGYTEFLVAESGKAALAQVLNYPNPFTTNTYFQFEHNLAGSLLDVHIGIYTVSGRLVKSIFHTAPADGFRVNDINWDGRDEYGDQLARGVYIYKIKVRGTDFNGNIAQAESGFEKLVIIK